MKTIIQKTMFLAILIVAFGVRALPATPDQQNRNVPSFSKIAVSSGIDLYLVQSETESVKVEADADWIDQIITEVEGETLKIYIKNRSNWEWGWNKPRKVYVNFDDLTSLDASAGADVTADGKIKTQRLTVSISSGADVTLANLEATELHIDSSSGADAKISGTVQTLFADASSGSDIDCANLDADTCTASASSGADIIVWANQSLTANASSGGDVEYKGDPKQKNISESSAGDVSRY